MTDVEHKKNKVAKLEAGNQRSFDELREATGKRFTMDTSDLRRELLIEFLVDWGVITEEQRLDFEITFHEQVEDALNEAWDSWKQSQKPKISIVKNDSKLLDQHGRPIS